MSLLEKPALRGRRERRAREEAPEPRPVRVVRVDLPADGPRCTGHLSQTRRSLRAGSRVTGVPGWDTVTVVDDPVTRHGVQHVPVAAPGWTRTADRGATR